MKTSFIGYYKPSHAEFRELWNECIFAFDASALLDLYRSTKKTTEIFFAVLEKIRERIWLPYQAGLEYQENRLGVISKERLIYTELSSFLNELASTLKTKMHNHAIERAEKLVKELGTTAEAMAKQLLEEQKAQPDLIQTDHVRDRLTSFFDQRVGPAFSAHRLQEIYKEGEKRYDSKVPPGFKDASKGGTRQYGDLVIWFEVLEHARVAKKPIVYITSDAKEDWWWEQGQLTIGPRPELVQEMYTEANARFYMYDLERFLQQATEYLDLKAKAGEIKAAAQEFRGIQDIRGSEQLQEMWAVDVSSDDLYKKIAAIFTHAHAESSPPDAIKSALSVLPKDVWKKIPVREYIAGAELILGKRLTKKETDQCMMTVIDGALDRWAESATSCWDIAVSLANTLRNQRLFLDALKSARLRETEDEAKSSEVNE